MRPPLMRYVLRITSDAGDFYGRVTAEDSSREWDVEAPWTAAQVHRWVAGGYPGAGPGRFGGPAEVITAAAGRFTGAIAARGWEEQATAGAPGDQLYLDHVAGGGDPDSAPAGSVIAEIPVPPEPEPGPGPAPEPEPEPAPAADLAGQGTMTVAGPPAGPRDMTAAETVQPASNGGEGGPDAR